MHPSFENLTIRLFQLETQKKLKRPSGSESKHSFLPRSPGKPTACGHGFLGTSGQTKCSVFALAGLLILLQ